MKMINNKFPQHFREFIIELNNKKVEYMLIGGYAMGVYGHLRATNDLDIYINATEENAGKMIKACIDYGIPSENIKKEMFLSNRMIGIGDPPLRIEILKKLDVIDFRYAYQRVKKVLVDDFTINVIDLDDLIILKKSALTDRTVARDAEDLTFLQRLKARLNKKG